LVTSTGIKFLFSCIESISTIFIFLTSLSPISDLPLVWPVFHSCLCFRCLFIVQWDFCLGIIPVHALWVSQCKPLLLRFLALFLDTEFLVTYLSSQSLEKWSCN
jgi:hypothetical protein